jgi:squalene-associated FAD-dependent desaturase
VKRQQPRPFDCIVVGGGLAGLSAACEMASTGRRILLLEHRQYCGGRTHSFVEKMTGDVVDNGQHLMMGCYTQTQRFLSTIGSLHLATLQPRLHIDFSHPVNGLSSLTAGSLPPPMHVLTGLMHLKSLRRIDRLRLLRVGMELLRTSPEKEHRLEKSTVDEWLNGLGQTEENKKYLWDVIAIGSLNDNPKIVSALLFFHVLRAAFVGTRRDSSLLLPNAGLSDLFVDPALRYLKEHDCEVRTGFDVKKFVVQGDTITKVIGTRKGSYSARTYVCTIPHYAFPLLDFAAERRSVESTSLHKVRQMQRDVEAIFESSPIITLNVWFDRPVMSREFVALLDCRAQWAFNRTALIRDERQKSDRQYLTLVISGAREYADMPKELLLKMALEDIQQALPATREAKLLHSLCIKEKRGTFSPKPGVEAYRPGTMTPLRNFFLAGDWTQTGLPSTIEGAVLSGVRAAHAVIGE